MNLYTVFSFILIPVFGRKYLLKTKSKIFLADKQATEGKSPAIDASQGKSIS